MPHCCCQSFNPNVVLAPGRRRAAAPALILRYIAFPRAAQNLWAGPPRHEIKCSVVVGSPTHITTHRLPVSSTICPYGSRSPPSKFDFWVSRKLHGDTGVPPTSNTISQPSRCSKTLSPLRPGTKIRFFSPSSPYQLPASDTTHPVPPPNLAEIKIRFLNVPRTSLRRCSTWNISSLKNQFFPPLQTMFNPGHNLGSKNSKFLRRGRISPTTRLRKTSSRRTFTDFSASTFQKFPAGRQPDVDSHGFRNRPISGHLRMLEIKKSPRGAVRAARSVLARNVLALNGLPGFLGERAPLPLQLVSSQKTRSKQLLIVENEHVKVTSTVTRPHLHQFASNFDQLLLVVSRPGHRRLYS
ncbi:hypothetical protein C8R43DRAFT_1115795 [Mycena crocata]|nr:hypothetical protein C8R43DRAFT_1115795 [Mycena crocata]